MRSANQSKVSSQGLAMHEKHISINYTLLWPHGGRVLHTYMWFFISILRRLSTFWKKKPECNQQLHLSVSSQRRCLARYRFTSDIDNSRFLPINVFFHLSNSLRPPKTAASSQTAQHWCTDVTQHLSPGIEDIAGCSMMLEVSSRIVFR